jgi:hypothetical protein
MGWPGGPGASAGVNKLLAKTPRAGALGGRPAPLSARQVGRGRQVAASC